MSLLFLLRHMFGGSSAPRPPLAEHQKHLEPQGREMWAIRDQIAIKIRKKLQEDTLHGSYTRPSSAQRPSH